jgi:methyl-accepting chemotaxis protein
VEDIKSISEETASGMKETKEAVDTLVRLAEDLRVLTEELAKG